MHHQRVGQQRAEHVELFMPMPRQLVQQGVGLRLAQLQILEEVKHETDFVEREANDIDLKGDGDDDLQGKFAAAQHTGNLAILVVWAAVNAVGNQHGPALFQTPDRPRVGQPAVAALDPVGIDLLGPFGSRDLVGGADTPAPPLVGAFAAFVAACLLPLLFGTQRKGFLELGSPGGGGQLLLEFGVALLQFGDSLLGGLQLTLHGHEQIDQPIGIDPAAADIFLELLDHVHACFLADSAACGKTSGTE